MAFMNAKSLATLKLRPIKKILKMYPTLLKNRNFFCLQDLKDFAFESQA
jgi:hypothetical protein